MELLQETKFYRQMKERFAGNIKCSACGNSDWCQFVYAQAGSFLYVNCKKCAHIQEFSDENRGDRTDDI